MPTNRKPHFAFSLTLLCLTIVAAGVATADNVLQGDVQSDPNANTSERFDDLFQGDLGAEIGIGCSNSSGTSGGPNFVAVGVTAPASPLIITAHYYNIFTNVSPTMTALTFTIWEGGGAVPGARIGQQAGLAFTQGHHSVAIEPILAVNSAHFFFGATQPQTDAALRWGLDTSSGGGTDSFIKAPGCGLSAWGTMTSIGFAGNWVMSVSVRPIGVPVELMTWGQVKNVWN